MHRMAREPMSALGQKRTLRLFLLNDLVRLGGEIRRHLDAERLGGLEVDDELKSGRLHHRQVCRFLPLENSSGVDASLAIAVGDVSAVTHQAARQREFTPLVDGRNGVSRRQRDNFVALAIEKGIGADQQFTPKSRHWNSVAKRPLCAKSGHSALRRDWLYSITSSARTSTCIGIF